MSTIWSVRGVSDDMQRRAAKAAKAAGMHLGPWVERTLQAGLDRPIPDGDSHVPGDLAAQLAALVERVDRLEAGAVATAPARPSPNAPAPVQRARTPAVASTARKPAAVNDIGVSEGRRKGKPLTDAERAKVRHLIETTDMSNPQVGKIVGITGEKVRHIRDEMRIELAAASGEHYVTLARGKSADSKPAKLIYSHLDLDPARKSYQRHLPPKPGCSIAMWRPDGSLVEFTSGPPVERPGR
jgi:hypothetical protein